MTFTPTPNTVRIRISKGMTGLGDNELLDALGVVGFSLLGRTWGLGAEGTRGNSRRIYKLDSFPKSPSP